MKSIEKIYRNILGTASVVMKVGNMRKADDFCVYPMAETAETIHLQSGKRWIDLDTKTGHGYITNGKGGHPNRWLLALQKARGEAQEFTLGSDELAYLKMNIFATAGKSVGNSVITSDNSAAANIL